jgi:glycosyltransferase involved in cell wall biosynthesis
MKNPNISIVFLWAEVVGYLHAVLGFLSGKRGVNITIVHWDKRSQNTTQYNLKSIDGVKFHCRSETGDDAILQILRGSKPSIIVVSGWMDPGYIKACRKYKKENSSVKIVAGIDDMWTGSLRQRLGQLYFKINYRPLFDYLWISGQPQYAFAQRFDYGIDNIISNLYSADTELFSKERAAICRRFVFVGRFVKIKAIDLLVEAYCKLPDSIQEQWPLLLIGDGDQRACIVEQRNANITVIPFLQPEELRRELLKGGVGCLPTHKDQWGVVLHEFALMGLPILASTGCGAVTEFLISGFNGYTFEKGDVKDLSSKLLAFTKLTDSQYKSFSDNSRSLSSRISTESSSASLMSILDK